MLPQLVDANGVLQTVTSGTPTYNHGFPIVDGKVLIAEWPGDDVVFYKGGFAFLPTGELCVVAAEPDAYIGGIGVSSRGELCVTDSAATHFYAGFGLSSTGVVSVSELVGGGAWTPLALFASGEVGAWYDPSDLDTMFQTNTATPVTAVEQSVGLILDKSQGLTLGSELVTNGDGSDTTGWDVAAGLTSLTSVGGEFVAVANGGISSQFSRLVTVEVGKWYYCSVTVRSPSSNSVTNLGRLKVEGGITTNLGVQVTQEDQNVTLSGYILATSTATRIYVSIQTASVWGGSGDTLYASNVSVKKIEGNHAYQATAASRPVLSALVGLWNNVLGTNIIASGGTETLNATTDPEGTSTAMLLTEDAAAAAFHGVSSYGVSTAAGNYCYSVYAKKDTRKYYVISARVNGGSPRCSYAFDLDDGSMVSQWSGGFGETYGSEDVGNGWWRLWVTVPHTPASPALLYFYSGMDDGELFVRSTLGVPIYDGDGTSGLYVWGFQIQQVGSVSDGPTTWQSRVSATDYDSDPAKFPYYLDFDGVDDSLLTGSIDLSGTDKLLWSVGFTKDTVTGFQLLFEAGSVYTDNGFGALASNNTADSFAYLIGSSQGGTSDFNVTTATYPVGTYVATAVIDKSQLTQDGQVEVRQNGAEVPFSGTDTTTPTSFDNRLLYIGRRANSTLPFNGRINSLVIRGAASSTEDIANLESYVSGKTGVTLA